MDLRKRDKINSDDIFSECKDATTKSTESINDTSKRANCVKNELSLIYWCGLFVCIFILFDLSIRLQSSCEFETDVLYNFNLARDRTESADPIFNDTLARQHLQAISRLGRRPAGSTANEVHTPGYILKYARNIVEKYSTLPHNNLAVKIDEYVSQLNSFNLVVFGKYHMSSIYNKLRSVAIRIHDTNNDINDVAILINCHYDSFFGGPGASDDLVSCVVMLETIHTLLRSQPITLRADIIMLFNGAEENILQASHAFITQHRWAKHVKFVVNLEAAGSGGRQMIFQVSPEHPWIVAELGRVLRQPFASVIGQEIFAANLVPSDTDFRIFRDFGNVPGVDLAFITNGYIYHTSYDTEQRIPQTCLRHTGDNILKSVIHLANVDLTVDSSNAHQSILSSKRMVFFDFLGFVLVSYSELTGLCLNVALLFLSLGIVLNRVLTNRSSNYFMKLLIAIANQVLWLVTSTLLSLLLGYFLHRFGCRMSWFSIRYNVIGLFLAPIFWYYFIYHFHLSRLIFRIPVSWSSAECHRHACIILIALFTIILSLHRLLSCYFIGMWLLFCIVNELLIGFINRSDLSDFNANILHVIRDLVSYSLPMTYYFYMLYTLYDFFIPILGRTGPSYPDLVIAALTGVAFIIPGLLFAGNIYATGSSSKKWLIFFFLHFTISYYIFIHTTQFGFPYNQSEVAPRKQRIFINHVTRNIRNSLGQTQVSESGLWILSLDTNNIAFLKSRLEQVLKVPMQDVFCELRPYCGYPLLFPFASVIDHSLWIPQAAHQMRPAASILVIGKVTHISGMVNITVQVAGPSHSPIYIMTPLSMRLLAWSLGPDPPQPIIMPAPGAVPPKHHHYFIFYGYGDRPSAPLTFWMTFLPRPDPPRANEAKDPSDSQIEIAIAAHYLLASTKELETMVHLMPKWTVPTALASSYEHLVVDFDQDRSFVQ